MFLVFHALQGLTQRLVGSRLFELASKIQRVARKRASYDYFHHPAPAKKAR